MACPIPYGVAIKKEEETTEQKYNGLPYDIRRL